MMNFVLEYDSKDTPKAIEIVKYTIGGDYNSVDYSWIEKKGEVILKIPCSDGYIILIREGYFPNYEEAPRCQIDK